VLLLLLACIPELDPKDSGGDETGRLLDADGDGYPKAEDCDDENPNIHPNADEQCNGVDDNCDGVTPAEEFDGDGDGFAECEGDCDDSRADIFPGAEEPCDFADNDCDGDIDEDGFSVFYGDGDQDGYGDPDQPSEPTCGAPDGYVANGEDCDDVNAQVNPAQDERCSTDADDDCDGDVNEDDAVDAPLWYADADEDSFGTPNYSQTSCLQPQGYVANDTDCDDTEKTTYPGADELCNGLDDDCDDQVPTEESDDDGDGFAECEGDCDDTDGGVVIPTWYLDDDNDDYGGTTSVDQCTAPARYVEDGGDCDDDDSTVNPGASEICDGQDNDCDSALPADEIDDDSDGFVECTLDSGGWDGTVSKSGDDCDDSDDDVNPGADEYCDGTEDEDCDGSVDESTAADASTWYADTDTDTFGDSSSSVAACDQPSSYVSDDTDCDDSDGSTYPGASEVCGDGVLNDCNATNTDVCGPWDAWNLANAQVIVRGDNANEEAGRHVAGGDVNGDGTHDLLVAADEGAYLFFGPLTSDTTLADADVAITDSGGTSSPTWVGWSADLSGDGDDDLHVSDSSTGRVYVLEGPLTADADVSAAVADFDLGTNWAGGWTVQTGDTDADGTLDLAISGPGFNTFNRTDAGAVSIWLGPVSGGYELYSFQMLSSKPDGLYFGPDESYAGYSTLFEDLDGDGNADLAVGAPLTTSGTVFVVLGAVTSATSMDLSTSSDATLTGITSGGTFGTNLAFGDQNGDGYIDLAVGDEEADSARGYAYLFNGSATGFSSTTAASADVSVRGPTPGYMSPVALDGDIDGDGYDDLLTAAPSNPSNGKGRIYFFTGPMTGTLYAASSRDGVWTGEASGDHVGVNGALNYAGDTDGDGFDDTLVGAYQQDTNGSSSGAVYLMLGGEDY